MQGANDVPLCIDSPNAKLLARIIEEGECFVGGLIYTGQLMTDEVEVLKPYLAGVEASGSKTRIILCTVKDDLHDTGKNIVRSMLEAKVLSQNDPKKS